MSKIQWRFSFDQKGQITSLGYNVGQLMRLVAEAARGYWINLARRELRTTAREYISSISEVEYGRGRAVIKLTGWLPHALEEGTPPYDMKRGLLRSPKARLAKAGGRYITVPLPIKAAGAKGASPPVMPKPIYRQAVKLDMGESLKLPRKYSTWGIRTRLSPDIQKWGHYTWKVSPFAGVTKVPRFRGMPTSGLVAYKVFRRVSRRSDPASWIHPGFRARKFMDRAAEQLEREFYKILDEVEKR